MAAAGEVEDSLELAVVEEEAEGPAAAHRGRGEEGGRLQRQRGERGAREGRQFAGRVSQMEVGGGQGVDSPCIRSKGVSRRTHLGGEWQ